MNRREVLLAAAGFSGLPMYAHAEADARASFPAGFLWGASTAAHQVEGQNTNSDYWFLENLSDSPFVEPSLDACDHYHRFADDIGMLADLGLNSYRFSLE